MPELKRKSWKIRVLRYARIIPQELYVQDPTSSIFKSYLKSWVKFSIPKDGDKIFKGKISPKEIWERDWLYLELQDWKTRERIDFKLHKEA